MNLPTEIFEDVIVVHAPEELGLDQAGPFVEYVSALERKNVVLDMDGTEAMDSDGLAALLDVQDRLHEEGGEMKIATGNPTNRKVFEITRLDQQLEVFESVLEAVKSFR